MPSRKQGKYQFEEFEVDLGRRSLRRHGLTIAVSPKTYDLLVFFVLNPNQTLSKEQLITALWPDTQEEETNLGQHIFLLRRALTAAQPGEKLVLAVPGHGYRFMPEVIKLAADPPREPLPIQRLTLRPGADPLPDVAARPEPAEPEKPREIHADTIPKAKRESRQSKLLVDSDPIEESESSSSDDKAPSHFITMLRGMKAWQLASVFLTLLAAIFFGWLAWHLTHRIVRDSVTVVIGDFENSTTNSEFDRALQTALLIHLEQSPWFSIASTQRVSEATTEMKLNPDQQITAQIAHDVCRQLRDQVYLTGAIRGVAQKYFITVQAFDCASNQRLAQSRGIADSANGVVSLLDRVAIDLRKQLGEPDKSVTRFSKPVFSENTASLTALKAYADALHLESQGKSTDAIPLFQRAIELDPQFVNAYADLGIAYANLGQGDPAKDNLTKAYNMRDQVNEQDKLFLVATYNALVTGDIQASIRNDQAWTAMYPRNPVPLGDLAALQIQIGKAALAVEPARRALELNPTDTGLYVNLAQAQMHLGQFDEAAATCNLAIKRHRDDAETHGFLLQIAFLRLDQPAIDQQLDWSHGTPDEPFMLAQQARIDYAQGKVKAARIALAGAVSAYRKQSQPEAANLILSEQPRIEAELGLTESALSLLSHAPEVPASVDLPVAWAATTETSRAAAILKRELEAHPSATLWQQKNGPEIRAAIAFYEHKPEEAIRDLQPASPYDLSSFDVPALRGRAYLVARQPEVAESEFHKILDHPGIEPLSHNYPLAQLGVARALAQQGKTVEAGFAYKVVFQIWKDADSDLPRLKDAKAEYAKLGSAAAVPSTTKPALKTQSKTPSKPAAKPSPKSIIAKPTPYRPLH